MGANEASPQYNMIAAVPPHETPLFECRFCRPGRKMYLPAESDVQNHSAGTRHQQSVSVSHWGFGAREGTV